MSFGCLGYFPKHTHTHTHTHKRRRSYNKKNTNKQALALFPYAGLFPILLIGIACFLLPVHDGADGTSVQSCVNAMDKALCSILPVIPVIATIVLSAILWRYKYKPGHNRQRKDIPYPETTINIIQNMLKQMMLLPLLLLAALPLAAQEKADSTAYRFRFVADNDMFFSPWSGNGRELERLLAAIEENRTAIEGGQMYLCVTSYGTSAGTEQSAAAMAYVRRNRVKSELIVRGKISETHFVTDRAFAEPYREDGKELHDIVVVTLPAGVEKVAEIAGAEAAAKVEAYNKEVSGEAERERVAAEEARVAGRARQERVAEEQRKAEEARIAAQRAEAERKAAVEQAARECLEPEADAAKVRKDAGEYRLALRANLLRWVTLTPDLGVEWRVNSSWGIVANGSWTSWSWNDKDRRYALWEVSPEVRYYINKEKRGYVGVIYKAGQFNCKLSTVGKQGDLMGGGITSGYQLRLNNTLSLDFNLGIGCIHADYEKYEVIDGVRVRQGKEAKNWWGPVNAGVTLVWKLF